MSVIAPHQKSGNANTTLYANAVFAGGGVRGIAHIGALKVAETLGYRWQHVAGTSVGAIVAALVAAGYTADELYQLMKSLDYKRFVDNSSFWLFRIPGLVNILTHGGLHSGSQVEAFMREMLRAKNKVTFRDMIVPGQENNADPILHYRLTVIASDITTGQILRLPQDAHLYGIEPDDFEIARAVRMSSSIPFFFMPVQLRHRSGSHCRIVDGALLSNLPLFLFERPGTPPDIPTFGFHLVNSSFPTVEMSRESNGVISLLVALIKTMLNAHDKLYLDNAIYVRTIGIPVDGISATQFNLTPTQMEQLHENGQQAAKKFFSTWDFEAYKVTYGSANTPLSRLEQLHVAMKEQAAEQTMAGVVTLPEQLGEVARVLVQQGELTLEEVVNHTRQDEAAVIAALTELMERGFIRSSQVDGEYRYKAVLLSRRRSRLAMSIDV
ncbi:MAG: patatin-like phospholipase family protein [Ktedonobacteraceae bacterium]